MHTVISFLSLFSFSVITWNLCNKSPNGAYEKNENNGEGRIVKGSLVSVISLYSFISFLRILHTIMVLVPLPTVIKRQSQPTRCGHTLTRCPLPGLARGLCPLRTPLQERPFARIPRQAVQCASVMCQRAHSFTPCLPSLSANKNLLLATIERQGKP